MQLYEVTPFGFGTCALGFSLLAIRYFLGALWAPDLCLDHGGSFDYRHWQCSQETQPYINTALREIPGFWFASVSILLAIVGTRLINRWMAPQAFLPKSEE